MPSFSFCILQEKKDAILLEKMNKYYVLRGYNIYNKLKSCAQMEKYQLPWLYVSQSSVLSLATLKECLDRGLSLLTICGFMLEISTLLILQVLLWEENGD